MKQKPLKTDIKNTPQQFGWKFWLWLSAAFTTLLIATVFFSAWAVHHILIAPQNRFTQNQSEIILSIATYPESVKLAFQELEELVNKDPVANLINRKQFETSSWIRRFPATEDKGYLLFSGVDAKAKQLVVKLIRVADGEEIARWKPDFLYIQNRTTKKKWANKVTPRPVHPILLNNGDVIFKT